MFASLALLLALVGASVETLYLALVDGAELSAGLVLFLVAANAAWMLALLSAGHLARGLSRAAGLRPLPLLSDPGLALRQCAALVVAAALFLPLGAWAALAIDTEVRTPHFKALSIAGALLCLLPVALLPAAAAHRGLAKLTRLLDVRDARRLLLVGLGLGLAGVIVAVVALHGTLAKLDHRPGLSVFVPVALFSLAWLARPRLQLLRRVPGAVAALGLVLALVPLVIGDARGFAAAFGLQSAHVAALLPAAAASGASDEDRRARLFPPDPPSTIARPARHLVLVSVDALRADHLPSYGYARDTAPAITRFFADHARVDRCYTVIPGTIPALVSLNTGLYPYRLPWQHGKFEGVKPAVTTLAEMLKARGFATTYLNYMYYITLRGGLDQGFDEVVVNPVTHAGTRTPRQMDRHERDGPMMVDVDKRVAAMAADRDRRHFLWIHFVAPHEPYLPHEGIEPFGKRAIDKYDGEIRYLDQQFERLVQGLERAGVLDDTLVILAADHGEAFGEHGKRYHGHTLFEEDVRVPCMVRGPGVRGVVVEEAGSVVDVVPTALDLLAVPRPHRFDGVSWVGALTGGARLPERSLVVRRVAVGHLKPKQHAVIRGHKKTLFTDKLAPVGTWDLRADPGEKRRLDDEAHARAAAADLRAFLDEMKRGLPR